MKRARIIIILSLLVVVGAALRIAASANLYLWQDEAETTISSLQVLEKGYPYDTFKGKPIFENASFIPSPDEKYQYEPTNYYGSKFERNKGWLTYYYQAAFLKVLGFNTFNARLPFILLFPVSLTLLYLLAKKLFNERIGMLASFIYAVNYFSIIYERQARYYMPTILLTLFCLYFFYQALTTRSWKYYVLSSLGIILLFYTHIVAAIAMGLFFLFIHVYHDRTLKSLLHKKVIIASLIPIALALPWLVLVRFWQVLGRYSDGGLKPLWLFMVVVFIFAYFFLKKIIELITKNFGYWLYNFSALNYLVAFVIIFLFIKPFITPTESIAARLFVELCPIYSIFFSYLIFQFFDNPHWRKKPFVYIVLTVGVSTSFILVFNFNEIRSSFFKTEWIKKTILYLDKNDISKQTPIFVSYQQLPFVLYSNYNVDLVWPIRKSYLDTYPGEIYFIFDKGTYFPQIFYREEFSVGQEFNYTARIKDCVQDDIDKEIIIYRCPPK